MPRTYTLLLLMSLAVSLTAQKHDNVWYLGYDSNPDQPEFGGTVIEFTDDSLNIYYEYREMNFFLSNASFSDSMGNLLFTTNNHFITDQNNEVLPNSEGLNPGFYETPHEVLGYPLRQGCVFLPSPIDSNELYLFHLTAEPPQGMLNYHSKDFYYSKIENIYDVPVVADKNTLILTDTFNLGKLTAVKHANGRSWWLILREDDKECYYTWLWDGEEFFSYPKQCLSEEIEKSSAGQALFSPSGMKFIYQNIYDDVELDGTSIFIYDFDRCTGKLDNRQSFGHIDGAWGGGVAVSPNSRFLYVSSYYYLYQYDLWAGNIEATKDTIAEWDGWADPEIPSSQSVFSSMQIGPDDKIYMCTQAATRVMHRINQPNLAGDSCDFVQRAVQLPTYNARSLPNFPNYRLGPLEGVECDPVSTSEELVGLAQVMVYPNPASDELFIDFGNSFVEGKQLQLFDALGQLVRSYSVTESRKELNVSKLPRGVYFLHIAQERQANQVEKVILN